MVRPAAPLLALLALCLAAPALSVPTHAQDTARIRSDLPRGWTGLFRWDGTSDLQQVTIRLTGIEELPTGELVARGTGRYVTPGNTTRITVRMLIDPKTLRVEIRESDPSQPAFETDGAHVGRLDRALRRICATWRTAATGQTGRLVLTSGGAARLEDCFADPSA